MSNYYNKVQQNRTACSGKVRLPLNLWRKAKREKRNLNIEPCEKKKNKHKRSAILKDDQLVEYAKFVRDTENEIRRILEDTEILSDIPHDCTPIELLGEIAMAKGTDTTVYVERDGLSTLTILLHQPQPTIAHLKRAIETISRVQMKRELQQRNEERFKRRHRHCCRQSEIAAASSSTPTIVDGVSEESSHALCVCTTPEKLLCSSSTIASSDPAVLEPMHDRTGQLVYAAARNGHHHQHRANVSWRYLWRTYALFNVHTQQPVNDANGGALLSDCGIENASTVKFCKREKYFGRKRQN